MKKTKKKLIQKLVDPGIRYLGKVEGAALGSTVGLFIAGPLGAVAGAVGGTAITDLFNNTAEELEKKYISKRESERIGVAAIYAINRIIANFDKNLPLRSDNFFVQDPVIDRSEADEILEGTLIAAKNEHEEKKLKYYGSLVANIAFHPEVDLNQANFLLKVAERLSYNQICILVLFSRKSRFNYPLSQQQPIHLSDLKKVVLFQEIRELKKLELLKSTSESLVGTENVRPSMLVLDMLGEKLYEMMNLEELAVPDIEKMADLLSDPL